MKKHILIPDVHYPKEDKKKVKILFDVIEWWQPDAVTILGDWYDADGISRWQAGRKEEYINGVAKTIGPARAGLNKLRDMLPDADIHFELGNHDLRIEEYIEKNAMGFADLPELTYRSLFKLDELNISSSGYNDTPTRRLGKASSNSGAYYVTHGSCISKHASQSGQKELEDKWVSGFSAHTHRLGVYPLTRPLARPKQYAWYECGHLCDPKQMGYTTDPNWQAGFAIAYEDTSTGNVFPSLVPFVGNVCMVGDKKFN